MDDNQKMKRDIVPIVPTFSLIRNSPDPRLAEESARRREYELEKKYKYLVSCENLSEYVRNIRRVAGFFAGFRKNNPIPELFIEADKDNYFARFYEFCTKPDGKALWKGMRNDCYRYAAYQVWLKKITSVDLAVDICLWGEMKEKRALEEYSDSIYRHIGYLRKVGTLDEYAREFVETHCSDMYNRFDHYAKHRLKGHIITNKLLAEALDKRLVIESGEFRLLEAAEEPDGEADDAG